MNEKELELVQKVVDDVEYLLDYARRVAQRQVDFSDVARLKEVRANLKKTKKVFVCL